MNGRALFAQLANFGDIDATEASVISWIDMAQKKASLDLPVRHSVTSINVTEGSSVSITNGVFKLISATCEDGEYPLTSIQVLASSMVFSDAADYVTVVYTGPAVDYTSLDEELTIHPSLHAPLVYFLISMYYDMEGEGDSEESGLAERFYQRWVYYRNLAIAALTGTDYDTFTRDPVDTTDAMPTRSSRTLREEDYYE